MRYKAPRGTRDILPADSWRWQHVERVFRDTAAKFGYREIRFPVFETTELFARGIGDSSDIVRKEMYTFEDKKGRSLTLRPEGTASVVRSYIEHGMGRTARLAKLYYLCPMFRYERPQAGRYRQFWQWGLEAIGSMSPLVDAEIIHFCVSLFESLGIRDAETKVNSAGCPRCTPAYNELLKRALEPKLGEFCPDCRERYARNPRRMFDCKKRSCQALLRDAPLILEALCDECREHFEEVQRVLAAMSVDFVVDASLARGFDYYTRTIFEVHHGGLGAQSALCGGGRYDALVEELGGDPTPACGVSAGLERLIAALESAGAFGEREPAPDVYVAAVGERAAVIRIPVLAALRDRFSVETDYQGRSLNKQMGEAGGLGVRFTVIIGDDEAARGAATVKNMSTGEQQEVELEDLPGWMARALERS
jgi:histidyl-tRNA synthetase